MPARKKTSTRSSRDTDIEIAAGGLVLCTVAGTTLIGIVHRTKYGDWALPKGRREPGERVMDTAKREVGEELGCKVRVGRFAGSYGYEKNGKPKVVLIWHMIRTDKPYPRPAGKREIREVVWLAPSDAINRLTHPTEKEFVRGTACDELRTRRVRRRREAR